MLETFFQEISAKNRPPRSLAPELREAIRGHRVVHLRELGLRGPGELREFYDELSSLIGSCQDISEDVLSGASTGQKWMEIRFDRSMPDRYRHASVAQPLHTDGSYLESAFDVALLYCERQALEGGETLFLDAASVISLVKDDSVLDQFLRSTPILFSKGGRQKRRPVIGFDSRGAVFTWNFTCIHPDELARHREPLEKFHRLLQTGARSSGKILRLRLEPGEGVFWQDERLLHGRSAFTARENNERFLWKTGIQMNLGTNG